MVVVGGFKITSCGPDPKEGSSSAADAELNERSKVGPAHVHLSIHTSPRATSTPSVCNLPGFDFFFKILQKWMVSQKNKIFPGEFGPKNHFWPILGLFFILGHFRAVFGPFFGGLKFFGHWTSQGVTTDSIFLGEFVPKNHFWPILGLFLILGNFRAVFGPFLGG